VEGEIRLEPREAVERLFRHFPIATEIETADAFQHIKSKFFKTFFSAARSRMNITPRIGLINRIIGAIFRRPGEPAADRFRITNYAEAFKIHEYGGTITAKGKQLAVPLRDALRGGRVGGRLLRRYAKPKEQIKNLVGYYDRRRHKYYLGIKRGAEGILPLFVLKRQVKVPARLGFFTTWNAMRPFVDQRLETAIQRAARKTEQSVPKPRAV